MTTFEIDDKIFREYTKMKIINGFLQRLIGLHGLLKEWITNCILTKCKENFLPND
jgi:hypothetical protein